MSLYMKIDNEATTPVIIGQYPDGTPVVPNNVSIGRSEIITLLSRPNSLGEFVSHMIYAENLLKKIWEDGIWFDRHDFEEVRQKARK